MGFFDDVKLTLLLTQSYEHKMFEKTRQLPSVSQTAHALVGDINTTLGAARKSADIDTRKNHVASTRATILRLKQLSGRCHALRHVDLEQAEHRLLQIERETKVLEQQAIARRNEDAQKLEKRGLIKEAIAVYEKLVAKMVDTPFAYRRLAILYRKLKSYDDEIRVLRGALSNIPKTNRSHYGWFKARLLKLEKSAPAVEQAC